MNVDTFGDGRELLWVMGWGNRADSRHERWLIDRLVEAGYRVHAVELPTNDPDFEGAYVEPLADYRADLDDHAVLAHSMGGLVTAHLRPDRPVVYLSPWWGTDVPAVARLLFAIPTRRRILPLSVDPSALGGLATAEDATAPDRISPAWISAMLRAQADLPPIGGDDVVFYTPDDEVVDPAAIEAHAGAEQLRSYEGGHELFASEGREDLVEDVIEALGGREG